MPINGPDVLLYEKNLEKHYVIMSINREERANSTNTELNLRITEAYQMAALDPEVWCIILTGLGDRFFCTGMDFKERADRASEVREPSQRNREAAPFLLTPQQAECWKPVIGAINGDCVGGGWMIAQGCDVLIAAENARFGIPEVRWNLGANFGAELARIIPTHIALEMSMWGSRLYTAQRMYEVGFVNKVVPREQLIDEAITWAEEVCEMGPLAVRAQKELIWKAVVPDKDYISSLNRQVFEISQASEDTKEGPNAFLEKRKPVWKLR